MTTKVVKIVRETLFTGYGKSGFAFPYIYSIQCVGFQGPMSEGGHAIDYKGATLSNLRKIAAKIAKEHGAEVIEAWKLAE